MNFFSFYLKLNCCLRKEKNVITNNSIFLLPTYTFHQSWCKVNITITFFYFIFAHTHTRAHTLVASQLKQTAFHLILTKNSCARIEQTHFLKQPQLSHHYFLFETPWSGIKLNIPLWVFLEKAQPTLSRWRN